MLCLFVLGLLVGVIGGVVALVYAKPRYELAQTFDLKEIDDLEVASLILDRNGTEIGRIFVQNRQPIPIEEVSPNFVNALIAAEDSRFHTHDGVDYLGVVRAMILNFQAGEITQGASTITQQLARNAFELKERSISRKVTEAFLAQRIEKDFTKEEILELYLNRIYFGSGFYGISAAAKGYFGKAAKDLTIPESATLAGVIRNPYHRSPFNFPDSSKKTRNGVLTRMRAEGMIDKKELKAFQETPLKTAPRGSATGRSKFVYEHVRQRVIDLIGYEKASEGGFRIATTIDNQVQRTAEESLKTQLNEVERHEGYPHQTREIYKVLKEGFLENPANEGKDPPAPGYLQGAALMIENSTGAVVALIGGRDFNDSMFDRTTLARRPPGTAFKPFVYAAAFESGHFPGTMVNDNPIDNRFVQIGGESGILGEWGSERFNSEYGGQITARNALAHSKNAATVRLGIETGLEKVVSLGQKAGIEFVGDRKNFNATFLGLSDASMEELCLAYTIFPNAGLHPKKTYMVSSIRAGNGDEIYSNEPTQSGEKAIDQFTAYQVSSCLSDALRHGTGSKAYSDYGLADFPAAGKTGTGYGFTDNWFIGYTSEVTCAVWAGFDQPKKIYQGAFSSETVLPVWTEMMNAATKSFEPQPFKPPSDAMKIEICSQSGELATDACYEVDQSGSTSRHIRSTYLEYLRPGTRINTICSIHGTPNSKPRTIPKLSPSFTGPDQSGGGLRAQPLVTSEPVIPIAMTVIGEDPYNSFAPRLRARVIVPDELKETPDSEEEEGSEVSTDDELDGFTPLKIDGGKLIARPITPIGDSEEVAPDEAPEDEPVAGHRVKLLAPPPIKFD